jgi:hydroxylamine reductase
VKGLCVYADRAVQEGVDIDDSVSDFACNAMFSTLTNVNFDRDRFPPMIKEGIAIREQLKQKYTEACKEKGKEPQIITSDAANYQLPSADPDVMVQEGQKVGVLNMLPMYGESLRGVREMSVYGIKGTAAYYQHAKNLGQRDPNVDKGIFEVLSFLESAPEEDIKDMGKNLGLALKVGEINLRVMELLDKGHREQLGTPMPVEVQDYPREGKCILVSGHDMMDIKRILEMAEPLGIDVYTHGEMLPAHAYPELNKHKNLAGHYGGAWQIQQYEFPAFPGPIVITTNCIIEPRKSYMDNIFTLNAVGWNGVGHVSTHSEGAFQPVLDMAQQMKGFTATDIPESRRKPKLTIGFGHEAILANAGTVIEAVQAGALKRVFLIGGCDGSENKRSYFKDLAHALPEETLILTLGCAKFRFNRSEDYGTLGDSGIPRLLDMGQCNDSYGAVKVALALAEAFKTDVNSLPLTLCISWFEQKAVAVLLSLLHLGIKNIHLGPVMPAFITPEVYAVLKEKFNLLPIDLKSKRNVEEDVDLFLQGKL